MNKVDKWKSDPRPYEVVHKLRPSLALVTQNGKNMTHICRDRHVLHEPSPISLERYVVICEQPLRSLLNPNCFMEKSFALSM